MGVWRGLAVEFASRKSLSNNLIDQWWGDRSKHLSKVIGLLELVINLLLIISNHKSFSRLSSLSLFIHDITTIESLGKCCLSFLRPYRFDVDPPHQYEVNLFLVRFPSGSYYFVEGTKHCFFLSFLSRISILFFTFNQFVESVLAHWTSPRSRLNKLIIHLDPLRDAAPAIRVTTGLNETLQ